MEKEKALDSKARIEEFLKLVSLTLIQLVDCFQCGCFVLVSTTENMSYCSCTRPCVIATLLAWDHFCKYSLC